MAPFKTHGVIVRHDNVIHNHGELPNQRARGAERAEDSSGQEAGLQHGFVVVSVPVGPPSHVLQDFLA